MTDLRACLAALSRTLVAAQTRAPKKLRRVLTDAMRHGWEAERIAGEYAVIVAERGARS